MTNDVFLLFFYTRVIPYILSIPLVLSAPGKYYLIQQGKTWSDAQVYCRATYTDLAIIQSTENMIQLQNEVQRQQFTSSAWIGMYNDVNSWRWSLGNEPLGRMRLWAPGQPNNAGGNQWCVETNASSWNDRACAEQYHFVCFDDTKTGIERYIKIEIKMSWPDAQTYCRTHYTDLASSRDATENSDIKGLNSGWIWSGLFRDSWKWIDKTNFSTISWMPGQPDNARWNENCGYLNNTQAADAPCSDIMPFFCYRVMPYKQVMRVKVRSNQDVNDPAVKAAILEQIKQKVKDHGIAKNIPVIWREQPDGKVFHKEKGNNTTESQKASRAEVETCRP